MIVFDLDPGPPAGLAECCRVALALKPVLESEGALPIVKTSGLAGLHIYGALSTPGVFADTRSRARSIAHDLSGELGGLVTISKARSQRGGRIFADWSQNSPRRSMPAPYSLRTAAIPLVSTPLSWEEVETAVAEGRADHLYFSPSEVIERTHLLGDLFRPATLDE